MTLKTVNSGQQYIVKDEDDGISVWWPDADAQNEIQAADDPLATAVKICDEQPMRGIWKN